MYELFIGMAVLSLIITVILIVKLKPLIKKEKIEIIEICKDIEEAWEGLQAYLKGENVKNI